MIRNLLIICMLFASHTIFGQQVITHNQSNEVTTGIPGCGSDGNMPPVITSDNNYFKAFDLSNFGINEEWRVHEVEFPLLFVTGAGEDGYPVRVRVWHNTAGQSFPSGSVTLLEEVIITPADHDEPEFFQVAFEDAIVPVGSELVVSISWDSDIVDDGGNGLVRLLLAGNEAGQTGPTFILSSGCGLDQPTDLADIGFPEAHVILNVTGDVVSSSRDLELEGVTLSPNPVSDFLHLDIPADVQIERLSMTSILGNHIPVNLLSNNQVDMTALPSGMYFLTLETNQGTSTKRVVKK